MSEHDPLNNLRDYADYSSRVHDDARRLSARVAATARAAPARRLSTFLLPALALAALLVALITSQRPPEQPPEPITQAPEAPQAPAAPLVIEMPPAPKGQLSVATRLDPPTVRQGAGEEQLLAVACRAPEHSERPVEPLNIVAVLDDTPDTRALSQAVLRELTGELGPDDTLEILPAPAGDRGRIAAGLQSALTQLAALDRPGARWAMLISDGASHEAANTLAGVAASQRQAGVNVSAVGLGVDRDDFLLRAISDAGGGPYIALDSAERLDGLFTETLDRWRRVASKGVSVEVALSGGAQVMDLYGYAPHNGVIDADGYRAFVGDMQPGEDRWVVARVKVPDYAVGEQIVADVTVRVGGEETRATQPVYARVSEEPVVADLDVEVGAAAANACMEATVSEGVAYWESGDLIAWEQTFSSGLETLSTLEGRYQHPQIQAQRDALLSRQEAMRKRSTVKERADTF